MFGTIFLFLILFVSLKLGINVKKGGEGSERERDKCVSTTHTEPADTINTIILQYPL